VKLSELRPCDGCGGALIGDNSIQFYVVTLDTALVLAPPVNRVLGLAQMFGGSLALAEVMSDEQSPIKLLSENGANPDKALLCFACYCKPIHLASLAERLADRRNEKDANEATP
jgi:hypothetical protein